MSLARDVHPVAVGERLGEVRRRIESAGGDPARIKVLAVTKGYPKEAVAAAVSNGLVDVGENYAQELLAKSAALEPPEPIVPEHPVVRWHFLGAIQRNKVGRLAPVVSCWQGVSRLVEARAIAQRRPGAQVMIEVETTGQPSRHGCPADQVAALAEEVSALEVALVGLMTVAPRGTEAVRRCFEQVGALADRLGLPERSMGMSEDLEEAVAAGSTMVRIGRALFGPYRRSPIPPRA